VSEDASPDAAAAGSRVREAWPELLATVSACADRVAEGWPGGATADRDRVVPPLCECLDATGARGRLPAVLRDAVDAAGGELPAAPTATPPHVAVTSAGPMLRATLDGGRLVVTLRTFGVERGEPGEPARYVRLSGVRVDATLA